jgi:alpha-glucosidase
MREHLGFHDATPVDAWTSAATLDTWRRAAGWHLQLFPYLYALAEEASRTGLPILRGMMLEFPYDPECWILNDQYLLGPALLCAPVLERGARERRVYLPRGAWYDWWTGERHEGPGRVTVPAPLERWPVLQRAGTSVPLLRDVPLDLNDERYANGDYDVEVRVRP